MALRRATCLARLLQARTPATTGAAATVGGSQPVLMLHGIARQQVPAIQVIYTRTFSKKAKSKAGGGAPTAQHSGEHHHHAPAVGGGGAGAAPLLLDVKKLRLKMDKALAALERDFTGVRGGKADPGMFDHIEVKAYGKMTPLEELAQVTIKSPTLAVINVYDTELLESVNTALKDSKLDLMPRVEGMALTVPLPKPSAEMRESLVKLAHQYTEKAKLNIRKVRREGLDGLKGAKDSASEDEVRRQSKVVETITEEVVKKAGELFERKKKEILTV